MTTETETAKEINEAIDVCAKKCADSMVSQIFQASPVFRAQKGDEVNRLLVDTMVMAFQDTVRSLLFSMARQLEQQLDDEAEE